MLYIKELKKIYNCIKTLLLQDFPILRILVMLEIFAPTPLTHRQLLIRLDEIDAVQRHVWYFGRKKNKKKCSFIRWTNRTHVDDKTYTSFSSLLTFSGTSRKLLVFSTMRAPIKAVKDTKRWIERVSLSLQRIQIKWDIFFSKLITLKTWTSGLI